MNKQNNTELKKLKENGKKLIELVSECCPKSEVAKIQSFFDNLKEEDLTAKQEDFLLEQARESDFKELKGGKSK